MRSPHPAPVTPDAICRRHVEALTRSGQTVPAYPLLRVVTTVDLLRSDAVRAALGEEGVTEAMFQALRLARMSVPTEQVAWVRQTLGPARVALCSSLRRRP